LATFRRLRAKSFPFIFKFTVRVLKLRVHFVSAKVIIISV